MPVLRELARELVADPVPPRPGKNGVRDLLRITQWWVVLHIFIFTVFVLVFSVTPVPSARALRSPTVLVLALSTWISVGSLLTYVSLWLQIPFIWLLLAWSLVCSNCNDNHVVGLSSASDVVPRPKLIEDFEKWRSLAPHESMPWIVVVTEGGGIRAAYWTAAVLTHLEAMSLGHFSRHLYAISSVSGGSLGAGVYVALVSAMEREQPASLEQLPVKARTILGVDSLAPILAKGLYPDFLQQLLPFAIDSFDRGTALEESWDLSMREAGNSDLFSRHFLAAWQDHPRLPRLFLNTTVVETGERAVASYPEVNDILPAVIDVESDLGAVSFVQAIHLSARFSYVSPAGLFRSPKSMLLARYTHVVDGGYFENSGATTGLEIIHALTRSHAWPLVVVLRYEEPPTPPSTTAPLATEALSPVRALFNTRSARAVLAMSELAESVRPALFEFTLQQRVVPLPLGWVLSDDARSEMDEQIQNGRNAAVAACLLAHLGAGPPTESCDHGLD